MIHHQSTDNITRIFTNQILQGVYKSKSIANKSKCFIPKRFFLKLMKAIFWVCLIAAAYSNKLNFDLDTLKYLSDVTSV